MRKASLLVIAIVILVVGVLAAKDASIVEWSTGVSSVIKDYGAYGMLIFVVLFCLFSLLLFPVIPLTVLAGMVYGMWGIPLVVLSATLAACLAFFLARYILHAWLTPLLRKRMILEALNRAVSSEQWKIVILLRMSQLLSFAMQNYVLAMSEIRFVPYAVGSAIGMTPAIMLQVYLVSLGTSANKNALQWSLLAAGVMASVAVLALISIRTRQAFNQLIAESSHNRAG